MPRRSLIWRSFAGGLGLALALSTAAEASRSIDETCPDGIQRGRYADVAVDDPHARAIDCLAHRGVVVGAAGDRYEPEGLVSRGQMATLVLRLLESSGATLASNVEDAFSDDDASVHEGSIDRLAAIGVVRGTGTRTYDPNGALTRKQVASFVVRAIEHRLSLTLFSGEGFGGEGGGVHEEAVRKAELAGVDGWPGLGFELGPDAGYDVEGPVRRDMIATFAVQGLDVIVSRPGWERAVELIQDCQVRGVSQTHSLVVDLELRDGGSHRATEPYIDAVGHEFARARGCPGLEFVATE